jgi:hypothetical protein
LKYSQGGADASRREKIFADSKCECDVLYIEKGTKPQGSLSIKHLSLSIADRTIRAWHALRGRGW